MLPQIRDNIDQAGWAAVRTFDLIEDTSFKEDVKKSLMAYKTDLDKALAVSPFGVPCNPRIWGISWNIQEYALGQY